MGRTVFVLRREAMTPLGCPRPCASRGAPQANAVRGRPRRIAWTVRKMAAVGEHTRVAGAALTTDAGGRASRSIPRSRATRDTKKGRTESLCQLPPGPRVRPLPSARLRSLRSTPYSEVSASASGCASHVIGTTGTTGALSRPRTWEFRAGFRRCARYERVCCAILQGCPLLRRLLLRG
jgi:hypothetical protein